METFVGLDVSLKETSVCVLRQDGTCIFEGKVPSEPAAIARLIRKRAPGVVRIGLESGPTSVWLTRARQKSDCARPKGDAACPTSSGEHAYPDRQPTARHPENVRLGDWQMWSWASRAAQELCKGHPGIDRVVASMVAVRTSLLEQIAACDRAIRQMVKKDDIARRLMTVPGVGPIVALAYVSAVDDPQRFTHARDVGAYLGLTPKRYQSGEVDLTGRISKCGDGFARTCLYEAAGVLLTRVARWSPLKAWGIRLMKRVGATRAKVAVARKLAVILYRIWTDGTEFWWTKASAMA